MASEQSPNASILPAPLAGARGGEPDQDFAQRRERVQQHALRQLHDLLRDRERRRQKKIGDLEGVAADLPRREGEQEERDRKDAIERARHG